MTIVNDTRPYGCGRRYPCRLSPRRPRGRNKSCQERRQKTPKQKKEISKPEKVDEYPEKVKRLTGEPGGLSDSSSRYARSLPPTPALVSMRPYNRWTHIHTLRRYHNPSASSTQTPLGQEGELW